MLVACQWEHGKSTRAASPGRPGRIGGPFPNVMEALVTSCSGLQGVLIRTLLLLCSIAVKSGRST
jgi:hypothetical protein